MTDKIAVANYLEVLKRRTAVLNTLEMPINESDAAAASPLLFSHAITAIKGALIAVMAGQSYILVQLGDLKADSGADKEPADSPGTDEVNPDAGSGNAAPDTGKGEVKPETGTVGRGSENATP